MRKKNAHYGFSSSQKITSSHVFRKVLQNTRIKCGSEVVIYYAQNQLENPRLGIIVSKRVSKKAVTRNYLKRTIRENFRLAQYQLKNWDVVVIVRYFDDGMKKNHILQERLNAVWEKLSQ